MNRELLTASVQAYIHEKAHAQPAAIALQKSPFAAVSASELAQQLDGRQRAAKKIPAWAAASGIYYPAKLNLEQCSSAETGAFKASLIRHGSRLIDLTGGFGVDSFYFAQRAQHVEHCEINAELSDIVAHNFRALQQLNVHCHCGDGIAHLAQHPQDFDYIYSDPSRRVQQQKVFRIEDCEPDIAAQQSLLLQRAPVVITKLAPLLDISLALQTLHNVKDVYIISVDNDCKELLFVQQRGYEGIPQIHAVRLHAAQQQVFTFDYPAEQSAQSLFAAPQRYLYDADVAINKAGAFKSVGNRFGLAKLHVHSHLYTADTLVADFPGRLFEVKQVYPLRDFKKNNPLAKANVLSKNFPLRVEEIRKKFKIADGAAQDFLFFTSLSNGEHVVIHGLRLG